MPIRSWKQLAEPETEKYLIILSSEKILSRSGCLYESSRLNLRSLLSDVTWRMDNCFLVLVMLFSLVSRMTDSPVVICSASKALNSCFSLPEALECARRREQLLNWMV